jgi:hypothetical protein
MSLFKALLTTAIAASLLLPAIALAKQADAKRNPRIVIHPKYPKRSGPHGFLPGYRQPPPLSEWRDRSPQYGGGDFSRNRRYWSGADWRYGWGGPGFYRGR